jgi:hypothetical protein
MRPSSTYLYSFSIMCESQNDISVDQAAKIVKFIFSPSLEFKILRYTFLVHSFSGALGQKKLLLF